MKTIKIQYYLRGSLQFTFEGKMKGSDFQGTTLETGEKVRLKNLSFVSSVTSEPAIQFVQI